MLQLDKSKLSTRVLGRNYEIRSALNKKLAMKQVPISNKIDNFRKQENKAKEFFDISKEVESNKYKLSPEQRKARQAAYNQRVGGYNWNGRV